MSEYPFPEFTVSLPVLVLLLVAAGVVVLLLRHVIRWWVVAALLLLVLALAAWPDEIKTVLSGAPAASTELEVD